MEFFWYDYETMGRNPRVARAAQFYGVRTNAELEEIAKPVELYCRPSLDWLPEPTACAVHELTPQTLSARGLEEAVFAGHIHDELARPNTCAVGYNATRFDHEVSRFLFWRSLRDPYVWHWRAGNTKWDLIDLMRAAYVLRPGGLAWPTNDKGNTSFRLQDLGEINNVLHVPSHTADADVKTLLVLARLVRSAQPRLFDYYLKLRDWKEVRRQLEDVFLWVSGQISSSRGCAALMVPLGNDPAYEKRLLAFDLEIDPHTLVDLSDEELADRLSQRDGGMRPVHAIAMNSSPFVVGKSHLAGMMASTALKERAGLDVDRMRGHYQALRSHPLLRARLLDAWQSYWNSREQEDLDVDEALYEGFMPDRDRYKLENLHSNDPAFTQAEGIAFEDGRLPELIFRYRARNFPNTLAPAEKERWRMHCQRRHLSPDAEGRTAMERYFDKIRELREAEPQRNILWEALESYGDVLQKQLVAE